MSEQPTSGPRVMNAYRQGAAGRPEQALPGITPRALLAAIVCRPGERAAQEAVQLAQEIIDEDADPGVLDRRFRDRVAAISRPAVGCSLDAVAKFFGVAVETARYWREHGMPAESDGSFLLERAAKWVVLREESLTPPSSA